MTKCKPVLHIGLPRTGTTAVQHWLAANTEALRDIGIFTFADTLRAHRLAVAGIDDPVRLKWRDIPPILACDLETAKAELASASGKAIVSSEYFSVAKPQLVRNLLSELCIDDVTIVLVLRRQDRYIESGSTMGGTIMTRDTIPEPHYSSARDWRLLVAAWISVFPNVVLKLYEECQASLCQQLFDMAGPNFTRFAQKNPAQRRNVSHPFRMPPKKAKAYLAFYRDSNRDIAKQFFDREELFDESDLVE